MFSLTKNILFSSLKIASKEIFFIFFLFFGVMILELLGLSLIMPVLTILIDPSSLSNFSNIFEHLKIDITNNSNLALFLLIFFLIVIFLRYALSIFLELSLVKYIRKIETDLIKKIFDYQFDKSWKETIQIQNKKFTKTMLSDIGIYVQVGILSILNLIKSLLIILLLFSFLVFKKGFFVLLVGIMIFLFFYFFIKVSSNKFHKISEIYSNTLETRYEFISQLVMGYKEMKIYQLYEQFIKKYMNNEFFFTKTEVLRKLGTILPKNIIEFLIIFSLVIFAILNVNNFEDSVPFLGLVGFVLFRSQPLLIQIGSMTATLQLHKEQLNLIQKTVNDILNKKIKSKIDVKPNFFDKNNPEKIEFINVDFSYSQKNIIFKNLSLKFEKNFIYGIQGSNGSGKSTFNDLLIGLHEPDKGIIKVNSIDLKDVSQNWSKNVSYLSQSYFIFNDSIKNNITLDFSKKNHVDKKLYQDSIKKTGMEEFIKSLPKYDNMQIVDFGKNLSGGQKQKIAFSRLLYKNSKVIILDEAMSAIDYESRKKINELLISIKKDKIIIIISHHNDDLKICDKIYKINNHQLEEI